MKALIVDDDLALSDVVSFTLRREHFEVCIAHDGLGALEVWQRENPDLIILDWNLPKLNGLEVCRRIRTESDVPILILSVRDEEDDIVTGLKEGADDYIVKPFSPRQLIARIQAVMRRSRNPNLTPERLTAGEMVLDPLRSEVYVEGELLAHLTRQENQLMQTLMLNKDMVLSAEALIDHVWGQGGGDRAMLKQLVYRLRQKIEKSPSSGVHLETVPAAGYSLVTSRKSNPETKI